jgi:uncharacterized membrane protein
MAKRHVQAKKGLIPQGIALGDDERDLHTHEQSEAERLGFARLVTFSDGVFAIAVTLLVLDIHLPESVQQMNNEQLASALRSLGPQYMAYIISFLVIGLLWMTHHRKFRLIQHYDRRLLLLNMLLLMVVAFIPFPTSVISQTGNRTATIFYALTIAVTGLISLLISTYAATHRFLLAPEISPEQMRREILRGILPPLIFLCSIGLAFINEDLARFFWVLLAPASMLFHRSE